MTSSDTKFAQKMRESLKQKNVRIKPKSDLTKNKLTPEEHYRRLLNLRMSEKDAREISGYEETV